MVQGYLHPMYAESFQDFGAPRELKHSGGWVLERTIRNADARDAMGLYPLFCCRDWTVLKRDLDDQGARWVCIALVTDPFGDYDRALLHTTFDIVVPYKDHYVADTRVPLESFVSKSHRKNARRALNKVEVEVCPDPVSYVDDWIELLGCWRGNMISGGCVPSRQAHSKSNWEFRVW